MGNATCGRKCRPPSNYESKKSTPGDGTLAESWFTSTTTGANYDSGAIERNSKEVNESDPVPLDVTPPVLSNGAPTGELSAGTTNTILSLIPMKPQRVNMTMFWEPIMQYDKYFGNDRRNLTFWKYLWADRWWILFVLCSLWRYFWERQYRWFRNQLYRCFCWRRKYESRSFDSE